MLNLEQLAEMLEKNRAAASARVKEFSIGGKKFNFNPNPAIMGVIKRPGAMVTTRMPKRESSRAAGSVRPATPAFDAA